MHFSKAIYTLDALYQNKKDNLYRTGETTQTAAYLKECSAISKSIHETGV